MNQTISQRKALHKLATRPRFAVAIAAQKKRARPSKGPEPFQIPTPSAADSAQRFEGMT